MTAVEQQVSATLILALTPSPGQEEALAEWRRAVLEAARRHSGFQASETFPAVPGVQDRWVLFLRFDDGEGLHRWVHSPGWTELMARAASLSAGPRVELVVAEPGRLQGPVSMVIETRVLPERMEAFKTWQQEMLAAERRFPGFVDSRLLEPIPGTTEGWTAVVRFDSPEHMDDWIQSEARRELMERVEPQMQGDVRRVVSAFDGWFPLSVAADVPPPPPWKQGMTVVTALFPIVMLLNHFVSPHLAHLGLNMPASILVGNVLSTAALSWLAMPPLNTLLKPWLFPREPSAALDIAGLVGLVAFWMLVVGIFTWVG